MPIADIYLRTTTPKGTGLLRQEKVCRKWCDDNGVDVRTVIIETATAFPDFRRQKKLLAVYDGYRKSYWAQKGEPLGLHECNTRVEAIVPPDFLVYEEASIFSRAPAQMVMFQMMLFRSIGVDMVWAKMGHNASAILLTAGIKMGKEGLTLTDGTFIPSNMAAEKRGE